MKAKSNANGLERCQIRAIFAYCLTRIMKLQYLGVSRLRIGKSGFLAYLHDDIFLKS